jgi:hypothetical protein
VPTEAGLVNRLVTAVRRGRRVALVLGPGITAGAVPGPAGMVDLADRFASERIENPDLAAALAQARAAHEGRPMAMYLAYRRAFAEWVSPSEFDIVLQHAVLQALDPAGRADVPGRWQRVGYQRGSQLESDPAHWRLPPGVRALGRLLAARPANFGNRVLTTNVDPLIEVAVRHAGGRARSLLLGPDAALDPVDATADPAGDRIVPAGDEEAGADEAGVDKTTIDEATVDVVHLHGYWRPVTESADRSPLPGPGRLGSDDPAVTGDLARELGRALHGQVACVIGYGGDDDALAGALHRLAADPELDLLWAVPGDGGGAPAGVRGYRVVESDRLFEHLERELSQRPERPPATRRQASPQQGPPQQGPPQQGPPQQPGSQPPPAAAPAATPRGGTSGHRIRQARLERLLGARPSADELLRQLDREFGWRLEGAPAGAPPSVLYWPVQLRQPTLIHAVQAIVAAALSARGVTVLLCFDDLSAGGHPGELRRAMHADVLRWFRLVDGARPPEVESLESFCQPGRVAERLLDPAMLVRPTHPWAVERDYYRHGTLYDLAKAVKAIPDTEAADADPVAVKTGLTTTRAERLWSPLTIWAYLHYLLLGTQAERVVTLGGDDEATMWRLWHEVFAEPVRHLYNPRVMHLRQDAGRLRANSFQELKEHLEQSLELPTWRSEGHYPHWVVQNGLLLSQYLRNRPALSVAGRPLDSWPAVVRALDAPAERPRVIQAIAREVSALLLGEPG